MSKDVCTFTNEKSNKYIKNVDLEKQFEIKSLVDYRENKVASLTMVQRADLGITIMAIDEGQGLSTHSAPGDAFITILEGLAKVMIEDTEYTLSEGESLIMPSKKPHSVDAIKKTKMMLVLVK